MEKYKDYIIELNKHNFYNYKPHQYLYYHADETDGKFFNAESIEQAKQEIDLLVQYIKEVLPECQK